MPRIIEVFVILLCAMTLAVEASHIGANSVRRDRERERERPQEQRTSLMRYTKSSQRWVF